MIHVDRSAVPIPDVLRTDVESPWVVELEAATAHYAERGGPGLVERDYPFKVFAHGDVKAALEALFHMKCAYCETKLGVAGPPDIEHFRPKGIVLDERGERHLGYWWLAGAWENLLIACVACNRRHRGGGKGNHFPIRGPRAEPFATTEQLAAEEPLLLDPTVDRPEEHLVFLEDGRVVSETDRGRTTIEILALNRDELVDARRQHLDRLELEFERMRSVAADDREVEARVLADRLSMALGDDAEYAGAARQVFGSAIGPAEELPEVLGDDVLTNVVLVNEAVKTRAATAYDDFVAEQSDFSISEAIKQKAAIREEPGRDAEAPDLTKLMGRDWLVERIEIENVKAIRALDLDLTSSPHEGAPWTVLLGENATGKSTVLAAVVLALIGRDYVNQLVDAGHLRPSDFVRRGADEGRVSVKLGSSMRTITFRTDGASEVDNIGYDRSAEAQSYVLGYGATRLLSPTRSVESYGTPWARVDNLFSPFQPLAPPDLLLGRLASEEPEKFDLTRQLWSEVISPVPDTRLELHNGEVVLMEHDIPIPVRLLSDGYQGALALVTDTLDVVFSLFDGPDVARGLVVVDELGSHLHPTWKMKVVRQLRQLLPSMQFIGTTHDPLCLRGLVDNETVLMRRHEEGYAWGQGDLGSTAGLRVDQLLTSRFFGLSSTIDPELDEQFDEYYQLLAMRRDELEQHGLVDRLDELKGQLDGVGMLGYTRRDQLIYEAIDEFLGTMKASEADGSSMTADGDAAIEQRRQEVFRRVGRLWTYQSVLQGLGEEAPGAEP